MRVRLSKKHNKAAFRKGATSVNGKNITGRRLMRGGQRL